MRPALGSCDAAAHRAAGRLLELECTRLEAAVGGHVARFGDCCFQTDATLQETIKRPDGKRYHRESIARARRALRDRGFISSQRIFTNGRMPGATYNGGRSSRGTTLKTFNWRAIAQKSPYSRRERRQLRQSHAAELRRAGELVKAAKPAHSSPYRTAVEPTATPRTPELAPDLAEAIERARTASERRGERTGPAPVRSPAAQRGPPD